MARLPFVRTASRNLRSAGKNLNAMLPSRSALLPRGSFLARGQHGATGGLALGALAGGAMALGALAIARLAIGKMAVGHAHLGKVEVDELTVHRFRVTDGAESTIEAEGTHSHPAGAEPLAAISTSGTRSTAKRARSSRKRNGQDQLTETQQSLSGEGG